MQRMRSLMDILTGRAAQRPLPGTRFGWNSRVESIAQRFAVAHRWSKKSSVKVGG